MKKKSLFALVAMVLLVAGVAFAALAPRGYVSKMDTTNPNAWSAYNFYTNNARRATPYFIGSGQLLNGINSADLPPTAAGRVALKISSDVLATGSTVLSSDAANLNRHAVVISRDATGPLSMDQLVLNTIYGDNAGVAQNIRTIFYLDNQTGVSLDVSFLDESGNKIHEGLYRFENAGMNRSRDIPMEFATPGADRWGTPRVYRMQITVDGYPGIWKSIPIYVDNVHQSNKVFEVAMFNTFNYDPDKQTGNANNIVANNDQNRTLGQTSVIHRFGEWGDRTVFDLGFVPDRALNVTSRNTGVADYAAAQLAFFVHNEGGHFMEQGNLGDLTTATQNYDLRYYYQNAARALSSYGAAGSIFAGTVSQDILFPGFTGVRQIPVADAKWDPTLTAGWANTSFTWTPAALTTELPFGTLDDVPDVQIRKMDFANMTPGAGDFGASATMYGGKKLMIKDTTIGWNVQGIVKPVSVKGVATIAFNAPLTNKYKADSPEVYAYPMQVTLRIVDQKVHDVFGGDKWRQLEEAWTNIGDANGLKKFLDILGPQKVVGGKLYPLAQLAFDKVKNTSGVDEKNDLAKYIQVRKIGPDYYVSFLMMVVDMANPVKDGASIVCHRNLFVVYDGTTDNALVDPMYIGEPTEVTPTTAPVTVTPPTSAPVSPTSGGSSSGGGCSAFGFAPLALLLLAPLALLRKRG